MQLEISHKRVISTWFSEIILCLLFLKINQFKEAYVRVVYSALLHHLRTGSEAQGTLFFFFFLLSLFSLHSLPLPFMCLHVNRFSFAYLSPSPCQAYAETFISLFYTVLFLWVTNTFCLYYNFFLSYL